MTVATLTIGSGNYSSWSLRAWLLTRMSALAFEEVVVPITDPANRAELLLLSPSVLTPRLRARRDRGARRRVLMNTTFTALLRWAPEFRA